MSGNGAAIEVLRGDITQLAVDAIVNAANERMLGGGGVDGAIHRAAGPRLLEACRAVPELRPGVRCPTGEVRITPGFDLPARFVIHTVGPVWRGGEADEDALLAACYRRSLALAESQGLESVAFPAISCGVYGFPLERACAIAVREIRAHAARSTLPRRVTLVGFDAGTADALRAALGA
jgi:O-acetyl-ADP-ribose deacetylase (regulator of RNase III)